MLRAVTYDYWQTLLFESPGGLEQDRVDLWHRDLAAAGSVVDPDALRQAHASAFDHASASWLNGVQYQASHAAEHICELLGISEHLDLVTSGFSRAGELTTLTEASGLRETLEAWRARDVRLGIVCDVGLTPSPVLRDHLDRRGLLTYFDAWSFSDETGEYKPHREPFAIALEMLGVAPEDAAHVGDRTRTDIAGARDAGMTAVRYTGVYDDPVQDPQAHHVVHDHRLLPDLLNAHSP